MGLDDRIKNAAEDLGGRAKEAAGAVSDNEELRREGRMDQMKADIADKVEDVKDRIRDVADDVKRKLD